MTQEQITKAFENRWRIKSQYLAETLEVMLMEYRIDHVKRLCRDFFETGIAIAECSVSPSCSEVTAADSSVCCDTIATTTDFDSFWNAYDKKIARPKCEKLWEKLTAQEKMQCMAYIPLYKEAQPMKQYRKNPETFLRNKSWNDEIINRNGNTANDNLSKLANVLAP